MCLKPTEHAISFLDDKKETIPLEIPNIVLFPSC